MNIAEIRKSYPQYNDLSDQALADGFHKKFYSDIPKNDLYLSNKALNSLSLGGESPVNRNTLPVCESVTW